MNKQIIGALLGASVFLSVATAQASTVNFDYLASSVSVAQGSFSYADGATGTLGYGDLSAFSVTLGPRTYTLGDVAGFTDYRWFGYDTVGNSFVTGTGLTGFAGGGFSASLAAINSTGTSGFFFAAAPGVFADYENFHAVSFDTILLTPQQNAVPEPASLILTALALMGLAVSRRRSV